jgi:hypothetical protein
MLQHLQTGHKSFWFILEENSASIFRLLYHEDCGSMFLQDVGHWLSSIQCHVPEKYNLEEVLGQRWM